MIVDWNKGRKCPEHSEKMKGRVAWNKGICFINYEEIKNRKEKEDD